MGVSVEPVDEVRWKADFTAANPLIEALLLCGEVHRFGYVVRDGVLWFHRCAPTHSLFCAHPTKMVQEATRSRPAMEPDGFAFAQEDEMNEATRN